MLANVPKNTSFSEKNMAVKLWSMFPDNETKISNKLPQLEKVKSVQFDWVLVVGNNNVVCMDMNKICQWV